ncbi:inner membrane protein [Caulobacter ginsengisoli]|uniref:Inner membrane protein n=1 Tax=Caulobacter ginsengisoli TaxID=400775 RepID=A0ABU0IXS9_9CAUL|nr:cell envelope integrity protein CreD [Caulobacter ginsengisoli]MDQ0466818.1 inner membrane protein [Caulobacter ginsengisoli]
MSEPSTITIPIPGRGRGATGWGAKALLVAALAGLMVIPALFVFALVSERTQRSNQVVAEVSALQGGSQQVLGPLLVAPYALAPDKEGKQATGWYVVSAETGAANATIHTSVKRRGIFEVPVYRADTTLDAAFAPVPQSLALPAGAVVDWSRAQIVVGFSDLRGAKADVTATVTTPTGQAKLAFAPASGLYLSDQPTGFGLVAAPAGPLITGGRVQAQLSFTGAQRLSIVPFAKSTRVDVTGDWSAPSFDGGFIADNHRIDASGFHALWTLPFIARGLPAAGDVGSLSLSALSSKDVGVTLARIANPYQSVTRSLKYAILFVGLVFLTFFCFEALSGRRLHPAQYLMVGLAQMIFYLLLLSLSEYVGFDVGFALAATATVGLIGLYAGAAFQGRRYAVQALVVFSLLYGLIYLLMRLEDFALLAGSLAGFIGLAAVMWLTRKLDWYGARPGAGPVTVEPSSPAGAV